MYEWEECPPAGWVCRHVPLPVGIQDVPFANESFETIPVMEVKCDRQAAA
jgi:hypothetical protein